MSDISIMMTREQLEQRKTEVLTTANRRILYDMLLSGMRIKEAAKEAKLQPKYVNNLVSNCGISDLVLRERVFLSQKAVERRELTAEKLIDKFEDIFALAKKKQDLTNMLRSTENLGRIIGAYKEDNEQQSGRMSLAELLQIASRKQIDSTAIAAPKALQSYKPVPGGRIPAKFVDESSDSCSREPKSEV